MLCGFYSYLFLFTSTQVFPTIERNNSSEYENIGSSSSLPVHYSNGDAMSDIQSECSSHLQVCTPYFGESFSQTGCPPDQQQQGNRKNESNLKGFKNPNKIIVEDEPVYQNVKSPGKETSGVNFIENVVYDTFTAGPPRFEIQKGEKGALHDMVHIKT